MRIAGEEYSVFYDGDLHAVYFEGVLRLRDSRDYAKIKEFLFDICELNDNRLICDFMKLSFLNSAGISTICKFVIDQKMREKTGLHLICNKDLLWQTKSFPVLRMLWEKLEIEWKSKPVM